MQINVGSLINDSLSAEQRIGAQILKAYGLSGNGFENLALMDIFGAPGHSAIGTSAMRDVEQMRGWNFTAILATALQFGLGNMAVYCPQWMAEAISSQYGEEYKASKRVTGTEQYGVPEDWVVAPRQHRIATLLKSPNPWTDEATFLFSIAEQTKIHGVAQILVLPNQSGLPQEMWVIPKSAIQPMAPSMKFPEGSYQVGHLSKLSINQFDSGATPQSLQQALARISNREYSARYVISVGLPSPVFVDDFLNMSSAISDTIDTDRQLHQSRRNMLEKLMTNGPRLEPMEGVTISNSEWTKIMEEFESQNMGPDRQGNAWRTPQGLKIVTDGHSGREMEFVNSVDQSRDHTLGQHLMSSAMLGLGSGGSYAQVIGLIKGNARLVLQPLMRIYSGQLTIGLRRFYETPQNQFMALLQAANIDDPEQRLKEWQLLKDCAAVRKKEVRNAFNMMPFGDEEDEKVVGEKSDPYAAYGAQPYGDEEYGTEADGTAATDSGAPESPGVGMPETAGAQTNAGLNSAAVQTKSPFASTMSRREFMRHSKNILDVVTKFKDGLLGEKTASLILETLGLPPEKAQDFINSVKDPGAEQSMSANENQTTATALFARMAEIKGGSFQKSIIDQQAETAATFPGNSLRQPNEKDLKAGVYRKGKVRLCGLMIEIENPAGSFRSGKRVDGSRWVVEMKDHYGYIVGAVGYDKDQLDIFIKKGTEPTFDGMVYVINQSNADGSFDEHKCFIGCDSKEEAIKRYLDNYDDNWADRIMSVAQLTIPQFKQWMLDPDGGPLNGEFTPEQSLAFMSIGTGGQIADPLFARAMTIKGAKHPVEMRDGDHIIRDAASQERPAGTHSAGFFRAITENELRALGNQLKQSIPDDVSEMADEDGDDPQEKAQLIAEILTELYGDDADALLADGADFQKLLSTFGKSVGTQAGMFKEAGRRQRRGPNGEIVDGDGDGVIFDGTPEERPASQRRPEQPVRRGGRRPRNTPERIAEIHGQIQAALKGERSPQSAQALADSLASLTVKQLHDIKRQYNMKASGQTKAELIDKIARRLDAGRRRDQSPQTKRQVAEVARQRRQAEASDRSQRANQESERFNGIPKDSLREISESGRSTARLHLDAAEALDAVGNTDQAQEHRRRANNILFHADNAQRSLTAQEETARQQERRQQQEQRIERDILSHLGTYSNQSVRDLSQNANYKPGENYSRADSPFHQTIDRLVREGKIVKEDFAIGGTRYSLATPGLVRATALARQAREAEAIYFGAGNNADAPARAAEAADAFRAAAAAHREAGNDFAARRNEERARFIEESLPPQQRPAAVSQQTPAEQTAARNQRAEEAIRNADESARTSTVRFQGIADGRDITQNIYRTLAMENIGTNDIEMLLDVMPPIEHDALENLVSQRRPETLERFREIRRRDHSYPQQNATQQRLTALRNNLPAKFVIAQSEDGRSVLVSPNDRARPLSADPQKQLQQIEDQLRRRGFDPDQVAAGNRKPQPKQPAQQPAATATAVAQNVPANAGEAQPVVARRRRGLTPQQRGQLKAIGADFLDDLTPTEDGSLILAQPESKGRVVITEGRLPQAWSEVSTADRTAIKTHHREAERKKIKNDSYWKYSLRDQAKAEARRLVDETMPGATESEKIAAVTEQTSKLMNGRSSWFKRQATAELDRRVSTMNDDSYLRYARTNSMLSSTSAPETEAALRAFGMKKQDLASVIGLPDDWSVNAMGRRDSSGQFKLYLTVDHPLARMNRVISMVDGKPHLYNSSFFANRSAPKGMGLDIFSKSVANAKRLGFGKIETMPCRSSGRDGMVGYAVWPQFGYDAPISNIGDYSVQQAVRARFPSAQTIRDVYDQPGGQEWWWANGTSLSKATFLLNDNSRNINALQAYMSKKKAARDRVRAAGTATGTGAV